MLKNKRDFKVVSQNNNGLSDSELSDLYKMYSSMDGKHKKFKGSKEDYVKTVSELIKNFVDSSMNETSGLVGGVKLREILHKNKLKTTLPEQKRRITEKKDEIAAQRDIAYDIRRLQLATNPGRPRNLINESKRLTRKLRAIPATTIKDQKDRDERIRDIDQLRNEIETQQKGIEDIRGENITLREQIDSVARPYSDDERIFVQEQKQTIRTNKERIQSIANMVVSWGQRLEDIITISDMTDEFISKIRPTIPATKGELDIVRQKLLDFHEVARAGKAAIKQLLEPSKIDLRDLKNLYNEDIVTIKKIESSVLTNNNIKIRLAKKILNKEFPKGIDRSKRWIEGTLPATNKATGVYGEKQFDLVVNPFYRAKTNSDIPTFIGNPSQQYQKMVDYVVKYYTFVKSIFVQSGVGVDDDGELIKVFKDQKEGHADPKMNKTLLRNFLIAAPFEHLTELSPRGYAQRREFAGHLIALKRKTLVGTTKLGWSETEEGSYRSEQFVYWGYLARSEPDPIKRTCKQFELLSKIFSLESANERVDYNFQLYTGESKGRKTLDGVSMQKGTKKPQIDVDKIISIIAHAATVDDDGEVTYNSPNALFTLYKSDNNLAKFDETLPINNKKMESKLPFEVLLRLNLIKLIKASENEEFEVEAAKTAKQAYGLPIGTYGVIEELNNLIREYHRLRRVEDNPKDAGKYLSFKQNTAVKYVGHALLKSLFNIEFKDTVEKKEYDVMRAAVDKLRADDVRMTEALIQISKNPTQAKDIRKTVKDLTKITLDAEQLVELGDKATAISSLPTNKAKKAEIKTILKGYFGYDIKNRKNPSPPEQLKSGDIYSANLVSLDISQNHIAKEIEVVGYSKSLFTVNGKKLQPTAQNYSKFFIKSPENQKYNDHYQDFTGDIPTNYHFDKIDIEKPSLDVEGDFVPIKDDIKANIKGNMISRFKRLNDDEKLVIINSMIKKLKSKKGDKELYKFEELPGEYEQLKVVNYFTKKYPRKAGEMIAKIERTEDLGDSDDSESVDSVDEDEIEYKPDHEVYNEEEKDLEVIEDDDKAGDGRPNKKSKSYHKKVIKYY